MNPIFPVTDVTCDGCYSFLSSLKSRNFKTDIFINFALASAKIIRKDMFICLQMFFSLKQF